MPDGEPKPRRPKTQRGRDRREQILRASETVIGERGFAPASIAEITRAAGASQGTFYIYFPSKEAVFRELVAEMGRMTRRAIARAVAGAPDRIAAERAGLRAFLGFIAERPHLYAIVEEAKFVDPEAYRDYFSSFAAAYRTQLEAAEAAGQVRHGDNEVRAWALMGLARALGERFAVWGDARDLDAVTEAAFDLIERGLRP
jgi:AcrR family transcriptional regulator